MKILLTGANGFVGAKLRKKYPDAVLAPSLRNASEDQVRRLVQESEADVIIHTAAISDIGTCEKDPDASYRANVLLPMYLAKAAEGRKLIAFSSDQVYSGSKEEGPYTEDMAVPGNVYARHKLEMEERVLDLKPDSVHLRAEWMYDYVSFKGNYYLNVLQATDTIAFSRTQYRGVTYLQEVADAMDQVIHLPGGAYNFGSETTKSIYEITEEFLAFLGKNTQVVEGPARHNLWMDCSKAKKGNVIFSEVLDGLKKCSKDNH